MVVKLSGETPHDLSRYYIRQVSPPCSRAHSEICCACPTCCRLVYDLSESWQTHLARFCQLYSTELANAAQRGGALGGCGGPAESPPRCT